jgi:uncharacterized protein (DUF1330 family)
MPRAYVLFTEEVTDPEGMKAYERASAPGIIAAGAKILVVDPAPQVLEGQWHGTRTVMLEFESRDAAQAWYDSAEYGRARPLRQAAARSNAVILNGFDMP